MFFKQKMKNGFTWFKHKKNFFALFQQIFMSYISSLLLPCVLSQLFAITLDMYYPTPVLVESFTAVASQQKDIWQVLEQQPASDHVFLMKMP